MTGAGGVFMKLQTVIFLIIFGFTAFAHANSQYAVVHEKVGSTFLDHPTDIYLADDGSCIKEFSEYNNNGRFDTRLQKLPDIQCRSLYIASTVREMTAGNCSSKAKPLIQPTDLSYSIGKKVVSQELLLTNECQCLIKRETTHAHNFSDIIIQEANYNYCINMFPKNIREQIRQISLEHGY